MLEPLRAYHENAIGDSALGQIGYHDANGNGIPDPIDTTPRLDVTLTAASNGRPSVVARAADQPANSSAQRAITINTISAIEYRADSGLWTPLAPADGAYDSVEETASATLPLYDGPHTIELRAQNRVGAVSPTAAQTVTVSGVGATPSYTIAAPSVTTSTTMTITLVAPAGFAARVSATPTFAGAAWLPAVTTLTYLLDHEDGDYRYYMQLRDENGLETPLTTAHVLLDRQPPTGSAHLRAGAAPKLDVQAQDALSGVAAIQLQGSDTISAWQAFTTVISLLGTTLPQHIRLRDRAGNVSAALSVQQSNSLYLPLAAGK